jgi:hypothetical protein
MTRAAQRGGLITTAARVLRAGLVVGLALLLRVRVVTAQAPPTPSPDTVSAPKKSATTATLLSVLLPGTGHLYAEDNRRGGVLLAMTLTGWALGAGGENVVLLPGMLLVGIPWWYAVIDAHNAVERYNRRRASRVSVVPWVAPVLMARGGDARRVGITVAVTLTHRRSARRARRSG